jgi:hypothetical protein
MAGGSGLLGVEGSSGTTHSLRKRWEARLRRELGLVRACLTAVWILATIYLSALPKPPWRKRKAAYVAHLQDADPSAVSVLLADKVHNVRTIVLDYRQLGESLWERFDPGADPVWYYRSLADVFARRSSSPLTAELQREVSN